MAYDIKEAAKVLKVSTRTVRRYIDKGLLKADLRDGKLMIEDESIRNFDKLSEDRMTTPMDPLTHVTLERDRYDALLTRLAQLEAERPYLLEYKGLSAQMDEIREKLEKKEDKRPWWRRVWR